MFTGSSTSSEGPLETAATSQVVLHVIVYLPEHEGRDETVSQAAKRWQSGVTTVYRANYQQEIVHTTILTGKYGIPSSSSLELDGCNFWHNVPPEPGSWHSAFRA